MSLAARCIAAIATGVVAADLPPKARAHVERRSSAKRRPVKPMKRERLAAKQSKREERNAKVGAIREAVFARAFNLAAGGARCEARDPVTGNRCGRPAAILDHWHGGSGKRRTMESVATCWALCAVCNSQRTANHPDAAHWNDAFELHCNANGLRFTPHYDARAAQRGTKP